MSLSFLYPSALWLLLLIPAALGLALAGRQRLPRNRRIASLALRALLLALLVLAAAGTQVRRSVDELTVAFLVDVSDSISPAARQQATEQIREAVSVMPDGSQVAVVVFGQDALVERTASDLRNQPDLASVPVATRTDIAEAIQLGLALLPGDTQKRMVLLSDGQANEGDARQAAELAAARGVPIDVVAIGGTTSGPEALISQVEAPSQVREGQQLELTVRLRSNVATTARLRVLGDDQVLYDQAVSLAVGETTVAVPVRAEDQGFRRFRAILETADDQRSENNEAAAFTVVQGPPQVMVVAPNASSPDAQALVAALQAAEMRVRVVAPAEMPQDLPQLGAFDSIVLVNVPATSLPAATMQVLPTYVEQLGRGLVMIGGPDSFGAGTWLRTPVEAALPVDMEVRPKEQEANIALVLAVDKSGSMDKCHCDDPNNAQQQAQRLQSGLPKVDIAKDAVIQASFALGQMDFVGVVAFDEAAHWALRPVQNPGELAISTAIEPIQAFGNTNIFAGLDQAEQSLRDVPARVKHVILLTDGWSRAGDYKALADRMTAEGITLSVVAAGRGSADTDLREMAELGGGKFYSAADIGEVPEIFLKETIRAVGRYIIEEPFFPAPAAPSPILRGFDVGTLPPLLGYNGTTAKPAATVALLTPQGDPLLAQWRYGLGRTVAWTSDLSGRWGEDWVRWENFGDFAAQLVGWTFPDPQSLDSSAEVRSGDAILRATAVDEAGNPQNFLETTAQLIGPDLRTTEVELPQVAAGQYEARLPLNQVGAYLVTIQQRGEGGEPVGGSTLGLVVPYSPEYSLLEPDTTLLNQLATVSAGRSLPLAPESAPRFFEDPQQRVTRATDLWPWLLLLAALVLPFDIAVRRVLFSQAEIARAREWAAARLGRGNTAPAPTPVLDKGLFAAKQRVERRASRATTPEDEGDTPGRPAPTAAPPPATGAAQPTPPASRGAPPPPPAAAAPPPPAPPDEAGEGDDTLSRLRSAKDRRRR